MDGAPIVERNLYLEQKKAESDREQMSLSEAGIFMHLARFSSHPGPKLGAYRSLWEAQWPLYPVVPAIKQQTTEDYRGPFILTVWLEYAGVSIG